MSVDTLYRSIGPGPKQEVMQALQSIEYAVAQLALAGWTASDVNAVSANVSNDSTLMSAVAAAVTNRNHNIS